MEGTFEYMHVVSALDTFHVDDIGNVAISGNNDQELEYILIIETDLGRTSIKEFGPLHPRIEITKYGFNFNIETKDYNERYINKRINSFLNAPFREITQVRELDSYEVKEKIEKAQELLMYTEKISAVNSKEDSLQDDQ